MKPKLQFYEVVRVSELYDDNKIGGLEGAILGMSQNGLGAWSYAVHIYTLGKVWHITEENLFSTGKMDNRETFYDGSVVSIQVDQATNEGRIVGYGKKDAS